MRLNISKLSCFFVLGDNLICPFLYLIQKDEKITVSDDDEVEEITEMTNKEVDVPVVVETEDATEDEEAEETRSWRGRPWDQMLIVAPVICPWRDLWSAPQL